VNGQLKRGNINMELEINHHRIESSSNGMALTIDSIKNKEKKKIKKGKKRTKIEVKRKVERTPSWQSPTQHKSLLISCKVI
jgi:hypothetical protein